MQVLGVSMQFKHGNSHLKMHFFFFKTYSAGHDVQELGVSMQFTHGNSHYKMQSLFIKT